MGFNFCLQLFFETIPGLDLGKSFGYMKLYEIRSPGKRKKFVKWKFFGQSLKL